MLCTRELFITGARKVARYFWTWWMWDKHLQKEQGLPPRLEALELGLLALEHSVDAFWWDWDRGSAPFFWRFPKTWQAEARDGLPPRFTGKPLSWKKLQRQNKDAYAHAKEHRKIAKVRHHGYISAIIGILSLLFFFSVPRVWTTFAWCRMGQRVG